VLKCQYYWCKISLELVIYWQCQPQIPLVNLRKKNKKQKTQKHKNAKTAGNGITFVEMWKNAWEQFWEKDLLINSHVHFKLCGANQCADIFSKLINQLIPSSDCQRFHRSRFTKWPLTNISLRHPWHLRQQLRYDFCSDGVTT